MYWSLCLQDTEMNIEEVEAALQQINNRLITEKEFQYIFFVSWQEHSQNA